MDKSRIKRALIFKLNAIIGEKGTRFIYKLFLNYKVKDLRKKNVISVLFILNDLAKWKSESLYTAMKKNPRFKVELGITTRELESPSAASLKVLELIEYLQNKEYPFVELIDTVYPNPDIIIYTEPYGGAVTNLQSIWSYWESLLISVNYSCHTTHLDIDYFTRGHECAWIDCYESPSAIRDAYSYIGKRRKNIKLLGLPMIDALRAPSTMDPWKPQERKKKRIIWAPHHSLGGFEFETIVYGNFLKIYNHMFQYAEQYKDDIQIAFKPHPLLKEKLESLWGREKTQRYYDGWANLTNGQLELGTYTDLFKHSDALIHDSSSFIVEYQIVDKPSFFMVRDEEKIIKDLNRFGKKAFYAQELGNSIEDIKLFIEKIIRGEDPNIEKRRYFLKSEIAGYDGSSASEKIISEILGKNV